MKTMQWLVGAFLVGLVGCSGTSNEGSSTATAQNAATVQNGPAGHDGRFLQHFDKNGDGKVQIAELPPGLQAKLGTADTDRDGVISPAELKAHHEQKMKERFAKADKNGDGALDATEVEPEHWAHLEAADANADGKVTKDEIAKAMADGKMHEMHGMRGARGEAGEHHRRFSPEKMMERLDKNRDGVIDASEMPDHMKEHASEIDTNKDGKLSLDELKAFKPPMRGGPGAAPPPAQQ